jgi:hypothetical protein
MQLILAFIMILLGALTACAPAPASVDIRAGHEAEACAAVKQAIIKELHAPADTTFGSCDAQYDPKSQYTVAVAINIPHADDHGVSKPDTFYYADAQADPKTGQIRPVTADHLVHN